MPELWKASIKVRDEVNEARKNARKLAKDSLAKQGLARDLWDAAVAKDATMANKVKARQLEYRAMLETKTKKERKTMPVQTSDESAPEDEDEKNVWTLAKDAMRIQFDAINLWTKAKKIDAATVSEVKAVYLAKKDKKRKRADTQEKQEKVEKEALEHGEAEVDVLIKKILRRESQPLVGEKGQFCTERQRIKCNHQDSVCTYTMRIERLPSKPDIRGAT